MGEMINLTGGRFRETRFSRRSEICFLNVLKKNTRGQIDETCTWTRKAENFGNIDNQLRSYSASIVVTAAVFQLTFK